MRWHKHIVRQLIIVISIPIILIILFGWEGILISVMLWMLLNFMNKG